MVSIPRAVSNQERAVFLLNFFSETPNSGGAPDYGYSTMPAIYGTEYILHLSSK